ncbi:HAD family hydrolase [Lacticaseibacillus sharpeae]|uniref:HAD superfamily hydrolase n=1 Tax=Lacticaseibacillus sharpeae JCM 1186 = DSM 20505 TaxID=1291052 RepID=A0A0R1ZL79_9LACO|nr:HAD family hydrolase [Lacticaseibacillus sharpeae]KRM55752.1 HAD superfamily hydrolase [Lacticaseibacillus sharpeae JCM 1186 = DSM 20505]
MEPHLIITDIDGTLAVDHQHVSPMTIAALNAAMDNGHQFFVATGRMYALAKIMADQVSDRAGVIGANGAVYDFAGERVHHLLGADALKAVNSVTTEHGLSAFYFSDDNVYYTQTPPAFVEAALRVFEPSGLTVGVKQVGNLTNLLKHEHEITNGIVISPRDAEGLQQSMADLQKLDLMHLSASNHDNMELIPRGIDKATAINELQQLTGIPAERTIVFGDGMNDIGMMKQAGVSVAMGNAVDAVKQVAKYETASNTEDGIAKFLNNYLQ